MQENTENLEIKPAAPQMIDVDEDACVFLEKKQLSSTPPLPADKLTVKRGKSTRDFIARLQKIRWLPPVLGVIAGVLWVLTCLTGFDADIGHVQSGAAAYILLWVCLCAGVAVSAAGAFFSRRVRQFRHPETRLGETFFGLLTAALFGIRFLQEIYTVTVEEQLAGSAAPEGIIALLSKVSVYALIFGALYFLCVGIGRRGLLTAILAMGTCVSVMLILFRNYYDFTLPLNSPVRNMDTLIYAAFLLFCIAEARQQLDLWYVGMPFAVFADMTVIFLTGGLGLGQAALALMGNTDFAEFSLIEQAIFVSAAGLAFCRLKQLPSLAGDHIPPPPTEDEVKKADKLAARKQARENAAADQK